MMGELYLPVLSHFQNENVWTASIGRLHFKVTPGESGLTAEIWEGPWSYDLSAVEWQEVFPLEEGGIGALRTWLAARAEEVNARPGRSFEENLSRRGTQS